MERLSCDAAELTTEFGVRVGRWAQYPANKLLPFDAMWCRVPAGGRTERDCHPEIELAVVVNGSAAFESPAAADAATGATADDDGTGADSGTGAMTDAPQGTAVLLHGNEPHVVHNKSADEPLILLSIYWLPE